MCGAGGHLLHAPPAILYWLTAYELPNIGIETRAFLLHVEKRLRVPHSRPNLQAVTYNAGVCEQAGDFRFAVMSNSAGVKTVKGGAVGGTLLQNGRPAKPCLRAFENEELEQRAVVVKRHAPLLIVIGGHHRIDGPAAPRDISGHMENRSRRAYSPYIRL